MGAQQLAGETRDSEKLLKEKREGNEDIKRHMELKGVEGEEGLRKV